MAAPRLISQAAFARLCSVSRMAISKACKRQLAPACAADRLDVDHAAARAYLANQGIDAAAVDRVVPRLPRATKPPPSAAPAAPAKKKSMRPGAKPAAAASKPPTGALRRSKSKAQTPAAVVAPAAPPLPAPPAVPLHADDVAAVDGIEAYGHLTLNQLVEQHGSDRRFKDWLDALKKVEDIRKTRLDNEETEGRLISRELVQVHVFGLIEAAFRRLLTDFPKTAALQIHSAAKSGVAAEESERQLRDRIRSHLVPMREGAQRLLSAEPERG